jgi:hypothetical protein
MADITEINGKKYEYEYKLSNLTGEVKFRDSAVVALEIVQNIFNPFDEGYITLSNPYNFIESSFSFRGDGTDFLTIELYPQDDRDKKLSYKFVITSERNFIDDGTQAKNRKNYIFVDADLILLKQEFPYNKKCRGKAGNIIKEILEIFKFEIDKDNFEPGHFEIKEFPQFYTPSVNFRYLDLIFYFLQYYYYIDGDTTVKAFLMKNNGKYQLKTLSSDIFAKNKELLYESFHSGDLVGTVVSNPNNPPPDDGGEFKPYINNIVSNNLTIPATTFSNTFFMNSIAVGYDDILGSSRMIEVRLKDVREKWKTKFVDVFSSIGGKVKKHLNLTKIKKAGEFKIYRFPYSVVDNARIVEADLNNSFTFYNQQININVLGDTGRMPGTFIDIFKGKNENVKADEKLLGRWLVTTVRHVKVLNTYRNEIFCTKTYAGPKYNDADA